MHWLLACINNMDETPITLDMKSNSIVIKIREKLVIKRIGHWSSFTVVSGYISDGAKLFRSLVFKCETKAKEKFPKACNWPKLVIGWY